MKKFIIHIIIGGTLLLLHDWGICYTRAPLTDKVMLKFMEFYTHNLKKLRTQLSDMFPMEEISMEYADKDLVTKLQLQSFIPEGPQGDRENMWTWISWTEEGSIYATTQKLPEVSADLFTFRKCVHSKIPHSREKVKRECVTMMHIPTKLLLEKVNQKARELNIRE